MSPRQRCVGSGRFPHPAPGHHRRDPGPGSRSPSWVGFVALADQFWTADHPGRVPRRSHPQPRRPREREPPGLPREARGCRLRLPHPRVLRVKWRRIRCRTARPRWQGSRCSSSRCRWCAARPRLCARPHAQRHYGRKIGGVTGGWTNPRPLQAIGVRRGRDHAPRARSAA
jgi:hypothetical protein